VTEEPTPDEPTSDEPPPEGPAPEESGSERAEPGAESPAEASGTAQPPAGRWVRTLVEWVLVLAVALGIALLVRTYVIQTYFIPSISMEPTLQVGDHILVLKAAYRFTSPAIGDVIVFKAPPQEHQSCQDPEVQDLVKRIIALPGDKIRSAGNTIFVNGKPLAQPWQHTQEIGSPIRSQFVGAGRYFVMGDNRPESCDSRVWGTVPRGDIIGKAVLIFWPLSRFGTI
jgi:signal peptidase I